MGLGRDIYSDITFFTAAWTGGCIRENVEDCTGQMDIKIIHIDYERNPADASVDGSVFRTILSVWNAHFHRIRMTAVLIGFAINYAAYFAEIYRGGIEAIPVGQYEAAKVLGYSKSQTFFRIVFPQVCKHILPAVTNEIITLVKDTSLAFVLAVTEMFTMAKQIAAAQTSMVPYIAAGIFYYVFNLLVAMIMEKIEEKLNYYH